MSNKVEGNVVFTVTITKSDAVSTIAGILVDLSGWRTAYELQSFAAPACVAVAGVTGTPTCATVTTGSDFKLQATNVVTTAATFSFSFTVRQGPYIKTAAVADAKCGFFDDAGFVTQTAAGYKTIDSFTPAVTAVQDTASLTLTTTSTDSSKMCASDPNKTQNGATGVIAKMGYTLGAALDLSVSKVTISLPMRLKAYSDGSVLGTTTRESMLPSDLSLLSVKIVHGTDTYWSSGVTTSIQSDATNDEVIAIFTNPGASIVAAEAITVEITGITNPPTTKALTSAKLTLAAKVSPASPSTYYDREQTSGTLSVGLSTCDFEQEKASASALIGSDLVGATNAKYRFQFVTGNVYPTTTGFRLTMPIGYSSFTLSADYILTCTSGCTAAAAPSVSIQSNVITFTDVFTATILKGTHVDLQISGWTNPASEQIYAVTFETIWDSTNVYVIDKFENLGELNSSGYASTLTEAMKSTQILIVDFTNRGTSDCRVMEPQIYKSPINRNTAGVQVIETSNDKFQAIGTACAGSSSFRLKAYAKFADGTRLNPRYAIATLDANKLIQVTLDPTKDTLSQTQDHAIFVQVTDSTQSHAINTFCFMAVAEQTASDLPNFCQSYCQTQAFTQKDSSLTEDLNYFIVSSGDPVSVKYTSQFVQVSKNPVMCPVVYTGSTRASTNHAQTDQAVSNFVTYAGSFTVSTSNTNMVLADSQSYETYNIQAATSAYTKTMPFTINFEGCANAVIVPVVDFAIKAEIGAVGESLSFTDYGLGFVSSDNINCPLGTVLQATSYEFCDAASCTLTSVANYWATDSNSLKVTRTADSSLGQASEVKITAKFGATELAVVNTIKVSIEEGSSSSNSGGSNSGGGSSNNSGGSGGQSQVVVGPDCTDAIALGCRDAVACSPDDLTLKSELTSATQTAIRSLTTGCSLCPTDKYFVEYAEVSGQFQRKCTLIPDDPPTRRMRQLATKTVNQPCDLGMLYDNNLNCTKPCSYFMDGCALCSSNTQCTLCADSTVAPLTLFTASGSTYSACVKKDEVCSDCLTTCTASNCALCKSANAAQCMVCNQGYVLQGTNCVLPASDETRTYYVQASTTDKILFDTAELTAIKTADGTQAKKFQFIQQAFNKVYSDSTILTKSKVTVNIILDAGDHFVFSCHPDLYATYTPDLSGGDFTDLCNSGVTDLQQIMPPTDNVDFVVTASGGLPTIHVLDSYYNFNVTKSLSFENIAFNGASALATRVPSATAPTHPPLATIPIKKCTLVPVQRCDSLPNESCATTGEPTQETWGSYKELQFSISSVSALASKYTCTDSGFDKVSVPMKARETCTENVETSTLASVRSCPGEPYHADFFTFDSVTNVPYKRHRVLFNLYNFDKQQASSITQYATLTLKNCKFTYFLADYEALINVETNNMALVPGVGVPNIVRQLGDQTRGFNLDISSSTFQHSRFCKGMIVYKKTTLMESTSTNTVQSYNRLITYEMNNDGSLIDIQKSIFENLNFGKAITAISVRNDTTLPIPSMPAADFPTFDNHGAVLNLQGFPGGFKLVNSKIENNLVFVPETYPTWRASSDAFDDMSDYINSKTGQVMPKHCSANKVLRYFFGDYLTSVTEQPSNELSQLESHSPIYVSLNRQPFLFEDNDFESNTGLFGGAISIDTPDFANDIEDSDQRHPYILLKDNKFNLTQAYMSGNAVYMRSTRQRSVVNETMQVCGAGLTVYNNTFTDSVPIIHASNGGAISLECDFVSNATVKFVGGSSNVKATTPFRTIQISDYSVDAYGQLGQYKLYMHAAAMINNTFTRSMIGQKGGAVYARQISNLLFRNNTFNETQPAMARFSDLKILPYQRLLLGITYARSVLYHNPDPKLSRNVDEWEYMRIYAKSYEKGGLIPFSQVQGAIYVENCQTCLVSHLFGADAEAGCAFCKTAFAYNVQVDGNQFVNNDDGLTFYKEHNLPRSSLFMAKGGSNFKFEHNTISHTALPNYGAAIIVLENYYNWLPTNFWNSLRAPLIRLDIPDGDLVKFSGNIVSSISHVQNFMESSSYKASLIQIDAAPAKAIFNIDDNQIDDLVTYGGDSGLFYGDGATIQASRNKFTRIGMFDQSPRNFTFYEKYKVTADYFPIDKDLYSNRTWTQNRGIFALKSDKRVESSTAAPQHHHLHDNVFDWLFCLKNCVIDHHITNMAQPQYMEFQGNSYSNIFGLDGALLGSKVANQADQYTYAIYNFTNEYMKDVQNGAIKIEGSSNDAVLLMQNMTVINSRGDSTTAIVDLSQGQFFACKECHVDGSYAFDYFNEQVKFAADFADFKLLNRTLFINYLNDTSAMTHFGGSLHQKGVFSINQISTKTSITPDTKVQDLLISGVKLGIRLAKDYNFVPKRNIDSPNVQNPQSWTYWDSQNFQYDLYEQWQLGQPDFLPNSLITNSTFHLVNGMQAVLAFDSVELEIRTTTFTHNRLIAVYASTLRARHTTLYLSDSVSFANNIARTGGAIYMTDFSNLYSYGTEFVSNLALENGGAIMFNEASTVQLEKNTFSSNVAQKMGSTIYASNGHSKTNMHVKTTTFSENYASQALMKLENVDMTLDNCVLLNNTAKSVTHGFSLSNSKLKTINTIVRNDKASNQQSSLSRLMRATDDQSWYQSSLNDLNQRYGYDSRALQTAELSSQTALAGFFYLSSQSELSISDSQVIGTSGKMASVAYLTTGSSLNLDRVWINDLEAPSGCQYENSGVIVGNLASVIRVRDSQLSNNDCSYIFSDRTPVEIKNTVFKDGRNKPYVNVVGSMLSIVNTTMSNASDMRTQGRGVKCKQCSQVVIKESKFEGMQAQEGGAVYLEESRNGLIFENEFNNNTAYQGGAIFIENSDVQAVDNIFDANRAKTVDLSDFEKSNVLSFIQRTGKGGGIYLTCLRDDFDLPVFVNVTDEGELSGWQVSKCSLSPFRNLNTFSDNVAESNEGADVYYTYINNTKEIKVDPDVCPDEKIGEYCVKNAVNNVVLSLETKKYFQQINDWKQDPLYSDAANDMTRGAIQFTSGHQIEQLQFTLVDKRGLPMKSDNVSIAEILFPDTSERIKGAKMSGSRAIAKEGVFTFELLDLSFQPDTIQRMTLSISSLHYEYAKQIDFLSGKRNFNFLFFSRACEEGETYTPNFQCQDCTAFTWSFTAMTKQSTTGLCPPCPQYGICQNGELYPEEGFVRMTSESEVFVKCYNFEACKDGNFDNKLKNCEDEYDGVMCSSCAPQHWKPYGTYYCYKCVSDGLQTIKFFACPILYFLFVIWLTRLFLSKFYLQNQQWIAIVRLFINMYQILQILTIQADDLSMVAPNIYLKTLIDYKVHAFLPMNWLIDFQCLEHSLGLDSISMFYATLYFYMLSPLMLLVINFLFWFIYNQVKACLNPDVGGHRFELWRLLNRCAMTVGICLFLVWPQITGFLLQATRCFQSLSTEFEGDEFVYRLRMVPDVICYDDKYNTSLILIIISLIMYNIVIPLLAARAMANNSHQMYISGQYSLQDQNLNQTQKTNDVKSFYGFFFSGLNLGQQTYTKAPNNVQDDLQDDLIDTGAKQKSLGTKCKGCFERLFQPVRGGVEVLVKENKNAPDENEYVRSYYHWEFIQFIQKLIMQFSVVFMSELSQSLQTILLLMITGLFTTIQISNKKIYYKKELNNLNLQVWAVVALYNFSKVVIRSSELDQVPDSERRESLTSVTGVALADEFKEISRSNAFSGGSEIMTWAMIVPVVIMLLITDLTFVWHLGIYVLSSMIESKRYTLFRTITLGSVDMQNFRTKYMNEDDFKDNSDDDGMAGDTLNMNLKMTAVVPANKLDDEDPSEAEGDSSVVHPEQVKAKVGKTKREKKEDEMSKLRKAIGLLDKGPKNEPQQEDSVIENEQSSQMEESQREDPDGNNQSSNAPATGSEQQPDSSEQNEKVPQSSSEMSDVQQSQHEIGRGLDIVQERQVADRGQYGVMAAKHDQSDTVGDGLGDTTHQQSYGGQASKIEDNDGGKSEPDVESQKDDDFSQNNSDREEEQKGEAPHQNIQLNALNGFQKGSERSSDQILSPNEDSEGARDSGKVEEGKGKSQDGSEKDEGKEKKGKNVQAPPRRRRLRVESRESNSDGDVGAADEGAGRKHPHSRKNVKKSGDKKESRDKKIEAPPRHRRKIAIKDSDDEEEEKANRDGQQNEKKREYRGNLFAAKKRNQSNEPPAKETKKKTKAKPKAAIADMFERD